MLQNFRNCLLVTGLFFIYSIVAGLLGYAWNFVGPHYIASSDRPRTTLLLFLIAAVPKAFAAALIGAAAAVSFETVRRARWAMSLALLITLYSLSGWSFGFNWRALDMESRIGWMLQALFLGAVAFIGFLIAERFTSAAAKRRPTKSAA